jgi:hypothetical protein
MISVTSVRVEARVTRAYCLAASWTLPDGRSLSVAPIEGTGAALVGPEGAAGVVGTL